MDQSGKKYNLFEFKDESLKYTKNVFVGTETARHNLDRENINQESCQKALINDHSIKIATQNINLKESKRDKSFKRNLSGLDKIDNIGVENRNHSYTKIPDYERIEERSLNVIPFKKLNASVAVNSNDQVQELNFISNVQNIQISNNNINNDINNNNNSINTGAAAIDQNQRNNLTFNIRHFRTYLHENNINRNPILLNRLRIIGNDQIDPEGVQRAETNENIPHRPVVYVRRMERRNEHYIKYVQIVDDDPFFGEQFKKSNYCAFFDLTNADLSNFRKIRRKNKKFLILNLIVLPIILIFMVFAELMGLITLYDDLKYNLEDLDYFKDLINNWRKVPIENIKLNDNCTSKDNNFINHIWPGTGWGCDCDGIVINGECGSLLSSLECSNVYPRNPRFTSIWKGNRICSEKINFGNYFQLEIAASAIECKNNHRSCGIIDTFGNHLCVENSKSCPMLDISFNDTNTLNYENSLELNTENIHFTYNETRFFNISEVKIPIQFKTSEGTPCLNPYYANKDYELIVIDYFYGRNKCKLNKNVNNKLRYLTDNIDFKIMNHIKDRRDLEAQIIDMTFYDMNYKMLDSFNLINFYKDNRINEVMNNLPFYQNMVNQNISLYTKNYIGLKHSCFERIKIMNSNNDFMENLSDDFKNIEKKSDLKIEIWHLAFFLFFIVYLFYNLYSLLSRFSKQNSDEIPKIIDSTYMRESGLIQIELVIINIFPLGLLTMNTFINFPKNMGKYSFLFENTECVDNYTIFMFKELSRKINTPTTKFILYSFPIWISTLLYIGYWIFLEFFYLKKNRMYPFLRPRRRVLLLE